MPITEKKFEIYGHAVPETVYDFVRSYIESALWSSTDDAGTPLDNVKYVDTELAAETVAKFVADCERFLAAAEKLAGFDAVRSGFPGRPSAIAHDFWLTRNRHGAGFWDGDYSEPIGKQLTDLSHSFGECDLYIGDDGMIYCG